MGNMKLVTSACFSHSGQFLTIGNDEGKAFLYSLTHFS